MQDRNADRINQRCYLKVIFGTSYRVDKKFYSLLNTDKERNIPGFQNSERFVCSVKKFFPEMIPSENKEPGELLVRTGWDNVQDQGTGEAQSKALNGIHYTDLNEDQQRAIRSWCTYYKMGIDFDFAKNYPFETTKIQEN